MISSRGYRLSWTGRRLIEKGQYTYIDWVKPKLEKIPKIAAYGKKYTGFVRERFYKIPPILESELKGMRIHSRKTGEFFGFRHPSLLQKPLPKAWLKKTTTRNIPGLLSVGQLESPQLIYRPTISAHKIVLYQPSVTVASKSMSGLLSPLIYTTTRAGGGFLASLKKHKPYRIDIPISVQERAAGTSFGFGVSAASLTRKLTDTTQIQRQIQRTLTAQKTRFDIPYKQVIPTPIRTRTDTYFQIPTPKLPLIALPPMMLGAGKGRKGIGKAGMDFRYLFREYDIGNLHKLMNMKMPKQKRSKRKKKRRK